MAVLWQSSRTPSIDLNGKPRVGAQAFFFDAGTTTPMVVYEDSALSTAHDQPVLTDANGLWPAVFLPPTQYRVHVNDPDGATVYDDDDIDPPEVANTTPPDAGSTDPTLLAKTGDIKAKHGTGAETGWVRGNGKSIGNAASGATERANADASALFQYLWAQDATLTVSGGRGSTAAGDFSAGKHIDLPNYINRGLVGLVMGGTDPTILSSSLVDNSETNDTLGATVGASTHALTATEIPSHTHTLGVAGAHSHTVAVGQGADFGFQGGGIHTNSASTGPTTTSTAPDHTHTIANTGGGGAHINVQPSALVTFYIKL